MVIDGFIVSYGADAVGLLMDSGYSLLVQGSV